MNKCFMCFYYFEIEKFTELFVNMSYKKIYDNEFFAMYLPLYMHIILYLPKTNYRLGINFLPVN